MRMSLEVEVRKTPFLSNLYIKTIILPRHAQDKHRESTQERRRFVQGCALRGNTVQGCGYNCIEMGGTTHMTLSDSVFLRDTPPDMFV
jgi:hypothetical protein